jgi:ABC-type nitrate/sulfonate/bicarbonate transport system substrate-binding protein
VRENAIKERPQAVRAFLQGWANTIAFMRANKDKAVEITAKVVKLSPSVASRAYDDQIGIFNIDGNFDPKAVAMLKKSFIEMGLLKEEPADSQLFTTQFLPVKPSL